MGRKRFRFSDISSRLDSRKPSYEGQVSGLARLAEEETIKPYIRNGELIIPSRCQDKYRWWAGGQPVFETLLELDAPDDVIEKYIGRLTTPYSWERWQKIKEQRKQQ